MTHPRIVFCTTAKGRTQHIEQTLPANIRDNADYPNCKFVLVDYCDPGPLRKYLRENHSPDIESGVLAVYHYFGRVESPGIHAEPGDTPFRMAHAKNMAHRLGILEGADILVNLDADNFTGPGFAVWVAEQFSQRCALCNGSGCKYKTVENECHDHGPPPLCDYCHGSGGRKGINQKIFLRTFWEPGDFRRGVNGRIVVTANAFLKAGGYDERYETWAPDDKDFNARLQRLGCSDRMIDRQYVDAVRHNDRMRFREYPRARLRMEEYEAEVAACENTVVNFGHFGEGVVFKNFGDKSIALGPVPTRIFGIGMQKTATTSLAAALKILGFDAAHWEGPQWAKNIWLEMRDGRSLTVERHYAVTDLPITLLYRQLDLAYPGSKFILTIRSEEKWLESVRKHWSYEANPFRASWDNEPAAFTHRIHHDLYGQRHFDAEVFLARYRRHNAEVLDYFKGRDGDLLVMDMNGGAPAGWGLLCRFLDRPKPAVEYPVVLPY